MRFQYIETAFLNTMLQLLEKYSFFIPTIVVIILVIIGLFITKYLRVRAVDNKAKYRKSIEINDDKQFDYAFRTSVGNAFVYGKIKAKDPVSVDWAPGKYISTKTITEKYTKHERTYIETRTDKSGHIHTEQKTEIYYSWDMIDSEENHSNEIIFCDKVFPYGIIQLEYKNYDIDYVGYNNIRHKHYIIDNELEGTVFTKLGDDYMEPNSSFFEGKTTSESKQICIENEKNTVVIFWVLWSMVICASIYGTYEFQKGVVQGAMEDRQYELEEQYEELEQQYELKQRENSYRQHEEFVRELEKRSNGKPIDKENIFVPYGYEEWKANQLE